VFSGGYDHNVNNNNRLMLRAQRSALRVPVTGLEVSGQRSARLDKMHTLAHRNRLYRDAAGVVQDTWTIGNNRVNEFRFQYARRGLSYFYNTAIPGGSDPAVNIPGFGLLRPRTLLLTSSAWSNATSFTDNFSWTIGRHDTKFGVDFNYIPNDCNVYRKLWRCVRYQRRQRHSQHRFPCLILSRLTVRACPATSFRESVTRMTRFPTSRWSFLAGLVAGPSELHF